MELTVKILFFFLLALSFSPWLSPPLALVAGILFGIAFPHPYGAQSRRAARFLLQAAVVGLGFGMNLHEVLKAGRSGFFYTAVSISFAIALGLGLGKLLKVRGNSSFLITTGTAICGGSAIAAIGPILEANEEEMAVSLGAVFLLNSVALFIFPPIGGALHLSESQFGLWAALAIHDTSSVVGAASKYGPQALVIGTTVKLARALWIVPLALATAAVKRSKSHIQLPWFILFFCLAALVNTYLPNLSGWTQALSLLGRRGLTATLFLIGTGISRATLGQVGWRPLLQALLLWMVVGCVTLYLIRAGLIAF
jgi:uncharacterized integral membrane protein (TIGR00698 family)